MRENEDRHLKLLFPVIAAYARRNKFQGERGVIASRAFTA